MAQLETPAGALAAAMLAHDAVEPAVETAGELEIGRIDGEDERVVENGFVEPVGDDQLNAVWPPVSVGAFLPFVDPREAVSPSLCRLTDRKRTRLNSSHFCSSLIPSSSFSTNLFFSFFFFFF